MRLIAIAMIAALAGCAEVGTVFDVAQCDLETRTTAATAGTKANVPCWGTDAHAKAVRSSSAQ